MALYVHRHMGLGLHGKDFTIVYSFLRFGAKQRRTGCDIDALNLGDNFRFHSVFINGKKVRKPNTVELEMNATCDITNCASVVHVSSPALLP